MSPDFAEHLRELFAPLGNIAIKRMFGGAGIYLDGIMLALVAEDVLYLKADDKNRARFEAENLEPFSYEAKGRRRVSLGYFRAPDEAMESAGLMQSWARDALGAALRNATKAAKASPRKRAVRK